MADRDDRRYPPAASVAPADAIPDTRSAAGLNLTRATLNAVLKYPWLRGDGDHKKPNKFGAYRTERTDYLFAREGYAAGVLSLEAQVMDHADAVAYSVHDLDDFYRAGLIPLQEIVQDLPGHLEKFALSRKAGVQIDFLRAAGTSRLASDIVASFTDEQAVRLCRRLTGNDPGSVTELVDG